MDAHDFLCLQHNQGHLMILGVVGVEADVLACGCCGKEESRVGLEITQSPQVQVVWSVNDPHLVRIPIWPHKKVHPAALLATPVIPEVPHARSNKPVNDWSVWPCPAQTKEEIL
jgi:hypothetical protein